MNVKKALEDYPEIMTAAHISEYLHISRRRVYELFQVPPSNGGIPVIQIGITKRVRKDSFVSWLNNQERKAI
ncbi:helix-turn-helix domain-containing protein [Sutcliffiella halmapala]